MYIYIRIQYTCLYQSSYHLPMLDPTKATHKGRAPQRFRFGIGSLPWKPADVCPKSWGYPLVNMPKTVGKSPCLLGKPMENQDVQRENYIYICMYIYIWTIKILFHGKIHYFYGHVKLPEGKC